jgi:hypothetical protein
MCMIMTGPVQGCGTLMNGRRNIMMAIDLSNSLMDDSDAMHI